MSIDIQQLVRDVAYDVKPAHIVLAGTVCFVLFRAILYPVFFSPLAKIPAVHWSCHFAPFWLWWARAYGWENRRTYALHQTKGPVLRIAPNQLSVNTYDEGLKKIYLDNFPRSEFYINGFLNYGKGHMFTMTSTAAHGARKKMFSNYFSKSYILNSPAARQIFKITAFQRLLPILHQKSERDEPISIPEMNYSYAMDSFANWQFGVANGCNLIQNEQERKLYLDGFFGREAYMFTATELPWLVKGLAWLGISLIPKSVQDGTDDIEKWNIDQCDRAARSIEEQPHPSATDEPLIMAQALKAMTKAGAGTKQASDELYSNRLEIASEMFSFNSAAHETSGNTLTYLFYELSRRPALQVELRQAFSKAGILTQMRYPAAEDVDSIPLKEIDAIPLLDAVIMETLRLYPSVAGPQPRVTPGPTSLGGYNNIPKGVIVQCYAHSLHRNPEVFPDPDEWYPQRWLNATPSELTTMRKWFWAFGSGASMCIGSNFALLSMKSVTSSIYSNFTSSIFEHGDMEISDAYLAGPRGGKLLLKFQYLQQREE